MECIDQDKGDAHDVNVEYKCLHWHVLGPPVISSHSDWGDPGSNTQDRSWLTRAYLLCGWPQSIVPLTFGLVIICSVRVLTLPQNLTTLPSQGWGLLWQQPERWLEGWGNNCELRHTCWGWRVGCVYSMPMIYNGGGDEKRWGPPDLTEHTR